MKHNNGVEFTVVEGLPYIVTCAPDEQLSIRDFWHGQEIIFSAHPTEKHIVRFTLTSGCKSLCRRDATWSDLTLTPVTEEVDIKELL